MPRKPEGFLFVTNQSLTPMQRTTLTALAKAKGKECGILHLQQLQNLLDSAPGYGVRIQYLGIEMTIEEQLSWAVDSDSQTAKALAANTRELLALRASVERMSAGHEHIIKTMRTLEQVTTSASTPDLISVSSFSRNDGFAPISSQLSPSLILVFHRLTCFDLPARAVGQLRTRDVWLGNLEGRIATHIQPPPPEQVEELLASLCAAWARSFSLLRSRGEKLEALVKFHAEFLLIHPFVDGNGRVARSILMQQCLDLFGKADMALMNKGAAYYAALQAADRKDFGPLIALITPVVQE
jgi:Fic family protein